MTPFNPEFIQTLEDLIPAICISVAMAVIVYVAFLHNALSNAKQTIKDQGTMLAEDIHLQADDLIKVQNAFKREDAATRKYNDLMLDFETKRVAGVELAKAYRNLLDENKTLKDKISRKNEPRDAKGHFAKAAVAKKNPNIGKYSCVNNRGIVNFAFTLGFCYEKYESKDSPARRLILIGDDRRRHDITDISDYFQLIAE